MKAFLLAIAAVFLLLGVPASAHLGSPDVFSEGKVGPYSARVTIRMPSVVPGRAEIEVQAAASSPFEVSCLPLYSRTAIKNSPPPEKAPSIPGTPGLYHGELWLMSVGAYGIEVRIRGTEGEGAIQIPVNSVATHQLGLPPLLGGILTLLGAGLVFGAVAIVRAAAVESTLLPGALPDYDHRRKGRSAALVSAVIVVLALVGGWWWWNAEEREFRRHLRDGAWPDLSADIRVTSGRPMLHLVLGAKEFKPAEAIPLIADHGKLLHLFLVRSETRDVFTHLHPIRTGGKEFEVALPPIPPGEYTVYCDLTLSSSALSSTATTTVRVDALPEADPSLAAAPSDPDDSWAICDPATATAATPAGEVCRLKDGLQITWRSHPPLQAKRNASLDFDIRDASGNTVALEPYMGMLSHAAVMREDGKVFAHLHPGGNYSMAAQSFFLEKLRREANPGSEDGSEEIDHSKMGHAEPLCGPTSSSLSIPYEFPSPGRYRLWLQFKAAGSVRTAVFDANVAATPGE